MFSKNFQKFSNYPTTSCGGFLPADLPWRRVASDPVFGGWGRRPDVEVASAAPAEGWRCEDSSAVWHSVPGHSAMRQLLFINFYSSKFPFRRNYCVHILLQNVTSWTCKTQQFPRIRCLALWYEQTNLRVVQYIVRGWTKSVSPCIRKSDIRDKHARR